MTDVHKSGNLRQSLSNKLVSNQDIQSYSELLLINTLQYEQGH